MTGFARLDELEHLAQMDLDDEPDRLPLAADVDLGLHSAEREHGAGRTHLPLAADVDLGLHSAEREHGAGRTHLQFATARQFSAQVAPEVEWLVGFYIAVGALVELVGRAKAAGKTTFLLHLIRALLDGTPFLGFPTTRTPVLLLTEQPPTSLRAGLERAGLDNREDLVLLSWRDARGAAWPNVAAAAVAECERIGAAVLIVDTLPAFAGIRGDAENDAGAALAAIEPLQAAAADGLAVIVVRHERKSGGEVGDSGRGSSAFTGAVDVVLRLSRQENAVRPTVRVLSSLSRFDETPPELVIELLDEGYVSLGDETAVAFAEARTAVLAELPREGGVTIDEIVRAVGSKRTTVQDVLASLQDVGEVDRVGQGRKGDPYRYRRSPSGFLSAGRSPLRGEPSPAREENPGPLTVVSTPTDHVACRAYREHQSAHLRTAAGVWSCAICGAAEVAW